jgi:hypothetical protein
MSNDKIVQHNVENDEIIVREFTDAEQAERDAEVIAWAEAKALKQAKADEDAAKLNALFDRLGITEDEAKLLLG